MSGVLTRTNNYSQNVVLTEKRWTTIICGRSWRGWEQLKSVRMLFASNPVVAIHKRNKNKQIVKCTTNSINLNRKNIQK